MKPYVIYALTDPRSGRLCYVGATSDARRRLRAHVLSARMNDGVATPVRQWIRELVEVGLRPILREIEEVPFEERAAAEAAWIVWLRNQGIDLLNVRGGGAGMAPRSVSARRNLREAALRSQGSAAALDRAREKVRGSRNSAAHRARIAEAKRGTALSDEHRRTLSESNFGLERSEVTRQRISAAQTGKKKSPEHRAANAAAQLRRRTVDVAARDARIRTLRAGGMTLSEIAADVELSASRVGVILHRAAA